jgi:hypothetical protein
MSNEPHNIIMFEQYEGKVGPGKTFVIPVWFWDSSPLISVLIMVVENKIDIHKKIAVRTWDSQIDKDRWDKIINV